MDRVRFGRAIGMGTRDAARALMKAADAAASPSPVASHPRAAPAARSAAQATHVVRKTSRGVQQGTRRFGEAIWGPIVKVSGVVWLEVTGVFFGIFALFAAIDAWKHRLDLHAAGAPRQHVLFAIAMLVVFGYFTLSSFTRASRRTRR